jgi:23S rRNA (guanine745-N1)-methyltransferase
MRHILSDRAARRCQAGFAPPYANHNFRRGMMVGVDARIVERLRCPHCRAGLALSTRTLRCRAGHCFDLARHGYADLTGGRVTHDGDTPAMVAAREAVLGAGHFSFVTEAVAAALAGAPAGFGLDVGAGTGHHLAAALRTRPGDVGLAVDVSKAALRRAARAHPRIAAVRADAWRGLPVAAGAASYVLNIFAPRAGGEFARVLAPDGRLVVVAPTPDHLRELPLAVRVDPDKERRLAGALAPWFVRENERELRATLRLSEVDAAAVAGMGPSAFHGPAADAGGPRSVTAAVRVSVWRPASRGED